VVVTFDGQELPLEPDLAGKFTVQSADTSDGDAAEGGRHAFVLTDGEEEFVVFAAVQGLMEGCAGEDGRRFDIGGNTRCEAEPVEVEREAVSEVHGGGSASSEIAAEGEAGFGFEVAFPGSAFVSGEAQSGASEGAGDIDVIAGAGGGAAEGRTGASCATEGDIGGEDGGVREVATGEFGTGFACQGEKSVEETVDPSGGSPSGESDGEEAEAGFGAHGGDVAKSSCEGFVSDLGGSVGFAEEMHVFDEHVGGEDEFVAGGARAKDGAVVSNTQGHAGGADFGADAIDDLLLRQHGHCTVSLCYSSLYMATRSVNKVILVGNLGRDAETKFTPGGSSVTKFSVATARRWKDQQSGEWKEETNWSNVTLWRAENLAPYLTKGKQVYVEGRLQTRSYEDKDGKKV
jgi:hypothetical protein